MAIVSIPHVSVAGDRKITAGQDAARMAMFVGNGIDLKTNVDAFKVALVALSMNVSVNVGGAIISGHTIVSDAVETFTIEAAHATHPRIDIVALENNINTGVRNGRIVIVKGTAAASPAAPALTNDGTIQQIALAEIRVNAAATSTSGMVLTDKRALPEGSHGHAATDMAGAVAAYDWTVVVDKDDWVGAAAPFAQTIAVTGMTADIKPIYDLVRSGSAAVKALQSTEYGFFSELNTANGSITIVCDAEKPTADITIYMLAVKAVS